MEEIEKEREDGLPFDPQRRPILVAGMAAERERDQISATLLFLLLLSGDIIYDILKCLDLVDLRKKKLCSIILTYGM